MRLHAPAWSTLTAIAAAVAIAVAAGPAGASMPAWTDQAALDRTVRYLQEAQNADGGFGSVRGGASDPGISAWVAIALAAAGINPFDQARPGGVDVATYLLRRTRFAVTTDYARAALVALAAGIPLRDFAGTDLVAGLLAAQLPDGSFRHGPPEPGTVPTGGVNDTAFAVLALGGVREPAVEAAVQRAVAWLLRVQNPDGGWEFTTSSTVSSSDITGAVVQALRHAGHADTDAERRALAFLRTRQQPDGGFSYSATQPGSNTASTAWATQALWAAGIDPRTWRARDGDPLDYLRAMQRPDGEIRWRAGDGGGANPIWMTAYCAPAFAGVTWPIAAVPRRVRSTPNADPSVADRPPPGENADREGAGGESPDGDGRVIAGGGGRGAPLFSRPQPQSRGRVAGGVRRVGPARAPAHRREHGADRPARDGQARRRAHPDDARRSAAARRDATHGAPWRDADAGGSRATTSAATGELVEGRVIATEPPGRRPRRPAAPGLRGAAAGGHGAAPVAAGLGGGLLVAALLGGCAERRRSPLPPITGPRPLAGGPS